MASRIKVSPLMRAIVDDPDDDNLRLIYADWLEDQGGEANAILAESIRIGIEEARLSPNDPRQDELRQRFRELISRNWLALRPPMPEWARRSIRFARGLPYQLECTARKFASGGACVLECAPIIELHLKGVWTDLPDALARPELARIRRLFVAYYLGTDLNAQAIASCPHLSGLRMLDLFGQLTDTGALALAESEHLGALSELRVNPNWIGPAGRAALRARFGDGVCSRLL